MDASKILSVVNRYKTDVRYRLEMSSVSVGYEFDWSVFIEQHQQDAAEYKIGTMVEYIGDTFPLMQGHEFKILASNIQDDEHTEYCLEGFPYLIYGDEIRPAQVRPENCRCLDTTFQALGCMCQKTGRMPG